MGGCVNDLGESQEAVFIYERNRRDSFYLNPTVDITIIPLHAS